jgi:proline racemase
VRNWRSCTPKDFSAKASPTGKRVSSTRVYTARIARTIDADIHHTRGDEAQGRRAIIPELTGSAHLIAKSEIYVNDDDPLRHGFTVADIWPGRARP